MKRRLFAMALALALTATAKAQDWRTCPSEAFREQLCHLVTQGNMQYDRSNRDGIKTYADSLLTLLLDRQDANTLERNDSIEFWAHWHKLCGDWYYEDGNYNEDSFIQSERHFNSALQVFSTAKNNIFETKISAMPVVHRDYAQLCYRLGRYAEALQHTRKAYEAYDIAVNTGQEYAPGDKEYDTYLELKSQLAICNARLGNTALALELINEVITEFPKNTSHYYEALRKKGKIILLEDAANRTQKALPLYKDYLKFKKADALRSLSAMTPDERQDYWMRTRPFIADCYQLENAEPAFLYDITLFAKGLLLQLNRLSGKGKAGKAALPSLTYGWRQIQAKLPKDACAIEFVQYEKDGTQKMAALVMRKTGTPKWVETAEPEDILAYKIDGITVKERLFTTNGSKKNELYKDSLFIHKVWNDRLVNAVGDAKKIYFAPDGYLHQLAIEYMPPTQLAATDFYRLTSTRRLMEEKDATVDISSALIVGGIKYDAPEQHTDIANNDAAAYIFMRNLGVTFNELPGSKAESDSIHAIRQSAKDKLLSEAEATEQAFMQHCQGRPIISIATHGYFGASQTPQGTDIKPCLTDETLSQSILALAGANASIKNDNFDARNADGILSAKELSDIDLSATRIAVISACQTGLGHITADGVYGIQRGLKNAGVGAMLVSLCNVDDKATCLLMTSFHKNLLAGMSCHKAFAESHKSLMQTKGTARNRRNFGRLRSTAQPATQPFDKPQYSNAFILIDATR